MANTNIWNTTSTTSTNISSSFVFNDAWKPTPFSLTFSWDNKEVSVSLKNGNDIFKLVNVFTKWLDSEDIEYNIKTKHKKKNKK